MRISTYPHVFLFLRSPSTPSLWAPVSAPWTPRHEPIPLCPNLFPHCRTQLPQPGSRGQVLPLRSVYNTDNRILPAGRRPTSYSRRVVPPESACAGGPRAPVTARKQEFDAIADPPPNLGHTGGRHRRRDGRWSNARDGTACAARAGAAARFGLSLGGGRIGVSVRR